MIWVFVAIAAVLVVGITWFTVTKVSARLAVTEAVAVYDLAAATEYVRQRLPEPVAGRLGREAVGLLLAWHLDDLRRRGVAAFGSADTLADAIGRTPAESEPDEALDALLLRAKRADVELDAVDAVVVLELNAQYMQSIGAVGEQVTEEAGEEVVDTAVERAATRADGLAGDGAGGETDGQAVSPAVGESGDPAVDDN